MSSRGEHGLRSGEGSFGINDPVDVAHGLDEAGERWRIVMSSIMR